MNTDNWFCVHLVTGEDDFNNRLFRCGDFSLLALHSSSSGKGCADAASAAEGPAAGPICACDVPVTAVRLP